MEAVRGWVWIFSGIAHFVCGYQVLVLMTGQGDN